MKKRTSKIISMKDVRMSAHKSFYLHLAKYKHLRDQLRIPKMKFKKK